MNRKATCLVTGGAGFIGSHLVRKLLDMGHEVICIDNLCTGNKNNIKSLIGKPGFTFLERDVKEIADLDGKVGFIFHLASRASPVDFTRFPIDILMSNSLGTYNILELARKKGSRFLLASTSEVYGDPKEHPQRETYWGNVNPNGERSCYDESKRFAEALAMAYQRRHGVDVRIVRIFNTYGPNMRPDDGRVMPNFINQAIKGNDITIYGDGKQTRSFCFVEDEVGGLCKIMFKEGINGGVFNLGNPKEYTILEIANTVKALTNSKSKIIFRDLPKDDPVRRKPDITKVMKAVGWEPRFSLEEGLRRTIDYFSEASSPRE